MYSHVRIGQFTGRMISGRVVPGTQNLKQLWLVKWLPIDLLKFRGPKKVRPKRAKCSPRNQKTSSSKSQNQTYARFANGFLGC